MCFADDIFWLRTYVPNPLSDSTKRHWQMALSHLGRSWKGLIVFNYGCTLDYFCILRRQLKVSLKLLFYSALRRRKSLLFLSVKLSSRHNNPVWSSYRLKISLDSEQQHKKMLEEGIEQTYRGVVALNNHAVTLLERHCHEQALATLRDAMLTMKSLVHHCPTPTEGSSGSIQAYTKDAAIRLANSMSTSQASRFKVYTLTDEDYPLSRIDSENPQENKAVVLPTMNRSNALYPIRIEHMSNDISTVELSAAIILYNFALANWSSAKVGDASPQVLHERVGRLLELPGSILDRLTEECSGDEFYLRRVSCVNAMVVRSLLYLLGERCLHQDLGAQISWFRIKLHRLEAIIQRIDETYSHWKSPENVAPAA